MTALLCIGNGMDFGMRRACALMMALADDPASAHQHRADTGIGQRQARTALGQFQGPAEVSLVGDLRFIGHFKNSVILSLSKDQLP
jgi:hypothetical protein